MLVGDHWPLNELCKEVMSRAVIVILNKERQYNMVESMNSEVQC